MHDINIPLKFNANFIVNLACPASPIHYQMNPVDTIKTNVLGSINLLDQATEIGASILQASTSEVYGDPKISPQNEGYYGNVNSIGPRSCYDEGKRCAEALFFDYNRQFNTSIKVIRIFNTYGPRMRPDDGRVISNFICQAISNSPVTIYGDGSQTRSFCYVDDLIEGICKMINADKSIQGPINLGNPQEISIGHVAKKIIELTNSNSKLIFKELPDDDPRQRKPDITLADKILDWKPSISLENGLKSTIDYFCLDS
jgi:UDP-glucuronate decarboxylase